MSRGVCRDRKKTGEPDITFEEWLKTIDHQGYQVVSSDIKWYPTTTTPTTTNKTTNTTTSTTTATAAAATTSTTKTEFATAATDKKVNVVGGELGKGVVFLSSEQIGDLLDRLGLDTFNYYVDKLSKFIINNGAHVKNHYETILKWLKTFYRRFFAQQFKRSCVPDGPKVGTVALSPRGDLRMPSDACVNVWIQDLEELE